MSGPGVTRLDDPVNFRAANRISIDPGIRYVYLGLRLVRAAP